MWQKGTYIPHTIIYIAYILFLTVTDNLQCIVYCIMWNIILWWIKLLTLTLFLQNREEDYKRRYLARLNLKIVLLLQILLLLVFFKKLNVLVLFHDICSVITMYWPAHPDDSQGIRVASVIELSVCLFSVLCSPQIF